ncbi:uncharacterized protein LOC130657379 [Hydractinia symbiolongicarpus]|nr:uncharacterized protein LOC130613357 [Hydractinia symbiolongicarpus]XP_057293918.1 uncharacterized protein LOC130622477 [Hydractinia symbiolongicarpus]XP_057298100.1 uncharacterized protein LOC130629024 [Hydractinia symbiolongicarpus]XP_057298461.1 uncharacterized protein LOC130629317 [Hydractinia symbiolongicarpus]XP_057303219.1 uncharacterized protein LOC130640719 [Hydractinia symbiolongicarpus]XP_057304805.1 uncharacterized protein LOC130641834 [Hydractinia symbiolongicarpus]XP_05730481
MLQQVKYKESIFRVFMYGDYEFLCAMYGITGANGRHSCLFCNITSKLMNIPVFTRKKFKKRSLATLEENLADFRESGGSPKNAKEFYNVIDNIFFDIPIDQVCIPGLHISLGVYQKMFKMFESSCQDYDVKIALLLATEDNELDSDYGDYIEVLKETNDLQQKLEDEKAKLANQQDQLNWLVISGGLQRNILTYEKSIIKTEKKITELELEISTLGNNKRILVGVGPCASSIDKTLQKMGVERQAYHGQSFIGNHVHKLLKKENIQNLTSSIKEIVAAQKHDDQLIHSVNLEMDKYDMLFTYFAEVHNIYNSAKYLSCEEILALEISINKFMMHLRTNWPKVNISPKLHMLEDHVTEFIAKWNVGFGFYGEQGGESLHHEINRMSSRYSCIKNPVERLRNTLKQHFVNVNPESSQLKPKIKKRKIAREE